VLQRVRFDISSVKWKNARPSSNHAYVPTDIEHVANIVTHGVSTTSRPLTNFENLNIPLLIDTELSQAILFFNNLRFINSLRTRRNLVAVAVLEMFMYEIFEFAECGHTVLFLKACYQPRCIA